jgi:tetratricopeptide (TPR) repeat protein
MLVNSKKIIITLTLLGFFAWSTPKLFRHALADFQSWLARQRLVAGDAEAATSLLAKSLQQVNSNPSYYYFYGKSLYAQARDAKTSKAAIDLLQQSQNAYEKATKLNPLEGNYWFRLAQTSWWLSKFKGHEQEGDKVETFFQRALTVAPNSPIFVHAMVQYYSRTGQIDKSLEYVNRLALLSPQLYGSLKKHSVLYGSMEDQFRQGLEETARNPLTQREALRALAAIAADRKDWARAAAYIEEMLSSYQEARLPHFYVDLGRYYLQLSHPEEAKKSFLQGLRISENPTQVLQRIFGYFRAPEAMDLYVELCRTTAAFDERVDSNLSLILGKAYFSRGELDTASEYFVKSLREQETPEAHRYLAEIAMKRKDWHAAERYYLAALKLNPNDKKLHHKLEELRKISRK